MPACTVAELDLKWVIDTVIAATAHLLEGRLVTQNVRHYPMFPGLVRAYG